MATTNLQNEYTNTKAADPRLQLNITIDNHAEPKRSSRTSSAVDTDDIESLDSEVETTMDRAEFFLYRTQYSDDVAGVSALGFRSHTGMNTHTPTHSVQVTALVSEAATPIPSDELEIVTTLFKLLNQVEESVAQGIDARVKDEDESLSQVASNDSDAVVESEHPTKELGIEVESDALKVTAEAKTPTRSHTPRIHDLAEALEIAKVPETNSNEHQTIPTLAEQAKAVGVEEVAEEESAVEAADPVVEAAVDATEEATEEQEEATVDFEAAEPVAEDTAVEVEVVEAVEAEEVAEEESAVEAAEPVVEAAVDATEEATEEQEEATVDVEAAEPVAEDTAVEVEVAEAVEAEEVAEEESAVEVEVAAAVAIVGSASDDCDDATLVGDTKVVGDGLTDAAAVEALPLPALEVKSAPKEPSSGGWFKNLLFRKKAAPESAAEDIAAPADVACVHEPVVEAVADSAARMDTQIAAGAQEGSAAIPQDPSELAEGVAVARETDMETPASVAFERQKNATQGVTNSEDELVTKTEEAEAASDTDSSAETKPDVDTEDVEQPAAAAPRTVDDSVEDSVAEEAAVVVEEEAAVVVEEEAGSVVTSADEPVEASADDQDVVVEGSVGAVAEAVEESIEEATVPVGDAAVDDGDETAAESAVEVVEEDAEPEAVEVQEAAADAETSVDEAAEPAGVETELFDTVPVEEVTANEKAEPSQTEATADEQFVDESAEDKVDASEDLVETEADTTIQQVATEAASDEELTTEPVVETLKPEVVEEEDTLAEDAANEHVAEAVVEEAEAGSDDAAIPDATSLDEGAKTVGDAEQDVVAEVETISEAEVATEENAKIEATVVSLEDAEKNHDVVEPVESDVHQTSQEEAAKDEPEEAPAATPVEDVERIPASEEVAEEKPKSKPEPDQVETNRTDATTATPAAEESEEKVATPTPVQKYEVDTRSISAVAFLIGRFEQIATRNAIDAANSRTSSRVSSRVSSPMPSPPSSRPHGYIFDAATVKNSKSSEPKELPEEAADVDTIEEDAETKTEIEAAQVEEPAVKSSSLEDTEAEVNQSSQVPEKGTAEDAAVTETEETASEVAIDASSEVTPASPEADTEAATESTAVVDDAATEDAPVAEEEVAEAEEDTAEDAGDEAPAVDEAPTAEVPETTTDEVNAEAIENEIATEEAALNTAEEDNGAAPAETDNDATAAAEPAVETAEEAADEANRETQTITTAYEAVETSILAMETPEDDALRNDIAQQADEEVEASEPAAATADFTTAEAVEEYAPEQDEEGHTPSEEPETDDRIEEDLSDLASTTKKTPVTHEESKESRTADDNQTEEPETTGRRMSSISPEAPAVQTDDAAVPLEATAKATVEMTSTSQATKAVADDTTAAEYTPERDSTQLLPHEHVTYEILGVTRANHVIMYHIYTVNSATGERSMSIPKRYSEFKLLDEQLRALGVPAARDLPVLPKPSVGSFLRGRRSKKTIELREKAFGDFLHYITQHEELHECAVFQQFIAH